MKDSTLDMLLDIFEIVMFKVVPIALALTAVAITASMLYEMHVSASDFQSQLTSEPEIVNATVVNDTGSAIILESDQGDRIVVGNTGSDSHNDIGYSERDKAYVDSTGVDKGDRVTVEKRGDFYSNVRKLESE